MAWDYKEYKNSKIVSKKYKVSCLAILKCSNSENLENKSSTPNIPSRKHNFKELCLIHYLYEK